MDEFNSIENPDLQDPWSPKAKEQDLLASPEVEDLPLEDLPNNESITDVNPFEVPANIQEEQIDINLLDNSLSIEETKSDANKVDIPPPIEENQSSINPLDVNLANDKKTQFTLENALTPQVVNLSTKKDDASESTHGIGQSPIYKRITNTKFVLQIISLILIIYIVRIFFLIF